MSLLTNWGYSLTEANALADMLTTAEFDAFTAGKYAGDQRTASNIKSASMAVRNYCNWHVYPNQACELNTTVIHGRVARNGHRTAIQLPAKYVTSVESVTINGVEYTSFAADTGGILSIYDVDWSGVYDYSPIKIEYHAGIPDALMDSVKELIAHRVTHALASSAGVQSETAGGVSITYSANWINSARATALADDNKEVLAPYKLQGVY